MTRRLPFHRRDPVPRQEADMRIPGHRLRTIGAELCRILAATRHDDRGVSDLVALAIIAAGVAVLALGVVATITLLVDNKIAGIRL